MTITTLSSRQLNQDVSRAKKAALDGPVIITDRGIPAHVLMTYTPSPAEAEFDDLTAGLGTIQLYP